MKSGFQSVWFPLSLALAVAMSACSCGRTEKRVTEPSHPWVEATLSRLSDEQKAGQLLCLTTDPVKYNLNPEYRDRIQGLVRKYSPGALYLFTDPSVYTGDNINGFDGIILRGVVLELQSFCDVPFLVAADFENGACLWDRKATRFPSALAFGATGSPAMAFREGKITAGEAVAQGVNWLFAPVVSIAPECGSGRSILRCFGSDPDSVAGFVTRYVNGTLDTGAAVCLTSISEAAGADDSGFPAASKPVASGISAGAQTVMASPALTPESGMSNTSMRTSFAVMPKTALAERYGFTGLVVRRLLPESVWIPTEEGVQGLIASFASGQDMLIFPDDPGAINPYMDFLFTRIRLKEANMSAVEPSVRKILGLKEKLNLPLIRQNQNQAISGLGISEFRQTAEDIAKASITLLRNDGGLIPLKARDRSILFVTMSDSATSFNAATFSENLENTRPELKRINVFGPPDSRLDREVLRRAGEADAVVCAIFLKPVPGARFLGLSGDHVALAKGIAAVNRACAFVSFSGPCLISALPGVGAFLAAYSTTPAEREAALDALFGESGISGRLPFALSEQYPLGFGLLLPGP